MCRLAAYLGEPQPAASVVFGGRHSLFVQSWAPKELLHGTINADGYGVAWYVAGKPARVSDRQPIWYDSNLRGVLGSVRSGCVLAALRNASPGIPVDRSSLAPMLSGKWAFVLNGFVPDFRRSHMRALRSGLTDELYGAIAGSSDTETLFLMAQGFLRRGASPVEALTRTARAVIERVGPESECQLNMVLADGERVAAVRTGTRLETNSLYVGRSSPLAPKGVLLASEALDDGGFWEPVDGHGWIEVHPETGVRSGVIA